METSMLLVSFVMAAFSFIPKLPFKHWFFRFFDFVKLQLVGLQILLVLALFLIVPWSTWHFFLSIAILIIAIYSNLKRIIRYTSWSSKSVVESDANAPVYNLLTINIFQDNVHKEAFIDLVRRENPDFLLMLEVDKEWHTTFDLLKVEYPFQLGQPLRNYYGIHFISKFPLHKAKVRYLVKEDIPSIDCIIETPTKPIRFYGIHPEPPSPTEKPTSKYRDAEMLRLASEVKKLNSSVIVSGDLNDVVWSKTSNLFLKESGLVDPRIGRGFYSTFNANLPQLLRFPVDQLYHTIDIECAGLSCIKVKGSDHMAIRYQFTIDTSHKALFNEENLDDEDREMLESSKSIS